ncbi:MAG: HAD-IA family hydrolase [Phycisphaerales bacterium]|nr:HAD-IA family hydrolase [Phycisphaerales bacterium]
MQLQWPRDWGAEIPGDVKGLIFDCDGTLVDTMPIHLGAWDTVLQRYGKRVPKDFYYGLAGMPTVEIAKEFAKELGIVMDADEAAKAKEELYVSRLADCEPIHRVVEIARREKGWRKMAVASGGERWVVEKSLAVIGLAGLFDAIVGADDCVRGKPEPEVFLRAAERIGVEPSACVVYEDAEMGFRAARAAGMRVIDVREWYLSI